MATSFVALVEVFTFSQVLNEMHFYKFSGTMYQFPVFTFNIRILTLLAMSIFYNKIIPDISFSHSVGSLLVLSLVCQDMPVQLLCRILFLAVVLAGR